MTNEQIRAYLAALLRERGVCSRAGDSERVEQIDAELRRFGASAAPPNKRAEKRS